MGMHYSQLSLEERRKLAKWRDVGILVSEIADKLGRRPSTLYRELARNHFADNELPQLDGYYAVNAQSMTDARRAVHRKLIRHPRAKAYVLRHLKAGWSPEQIAGRMRREARRDRVSHETIYRYAYSRDGHADEIYRHLPERRRKRRPRGMRHKLIQLDDLRAHIVDRLEQGWTPEQIAGRYDGQHIRVSHETIYAYARDGKRQQRHLERN